MAIRLTRAPHPGTLVEGEAGSMSQSYGLEQMSQRRMATGHCSPGMGAKLRGCWAGQGRGVVRGAQSKAPTPEMQEGGWPVGAGPWPCPLSLSDACHPSILSMSAVRHPPPGEGAAEDGNLRAFAVDIIHPNLPCACGDKPTQLLSGFAGERDGGAKAAVLSLSSARLPWAVRASPVAPTCPLYPTEFKHLFSGLHFLRSG